MVSLRNLPSLWGRRSPSARASPPYGTERNRWFLSVTSHPCGGGARLRLGPRRPTERRETDGFAPYPPLLVWAALAFGSGLAALRNREKPMVSLLTSHPCRGGARLRLQFEAVLSCRALQKE